MSQLNDLTKKAFYFACGMAYYVAEETEKNLNELGTQSQVFFDEAQEFIDDAIARGEAEVNGWNMPQNSSTSHQAEASPELKRQLFSLVGGNMELADRLLANVRQKYPNESENWYWEKVIYDLERDRQNY